MTDDGFSSPAPTPQADQPDWEALARYSAGECTPEESAAVRRWLDANPSDARALATLDAAAKSLAFETPADLDVEGALRRVSERLHNAEIVPIDRAKPPAVAFPSRRRWSGARIAGFAAAAAAAITVILVSTSRRDATPGIPAATPAAPRVYNTAVGQRDSVVLADGSHVLLGPASRLTVPGDYGTTSRSVELAGVAYFDVVHDSTKPFSVRDGSAVITDLGTRFTVEDDVDGTVHVAVTAGSVDLGAVTAAATQRVRLNAGDRGVLNTAGVARALPGQAKPDDLAWMRGRLIFRDAPMTHVAAELRRWYGFELRTDSALSRQTVTTSALATDPTEQVIRMIRLTLGARAEQRGDTVVLHSTRPRAAPQ